MMSQFLTIFVLFTFMAPVMVFADQCPSPCWCVDNNTIVVCNLTGITEVSKGIPKNVKTLLMSSNQISFIPKIALEGLNQLTKIDLSRNKLKEGSFENGALNLPSIRIIDLSSNLYTSIPQELPPKLSTLYLYNNAITTLKDNSFLNATSIEHLLMIDAQVTKIEDHAFDPLTNVLEIDLSDNKLVDNSFSPNAFVKTRNLTDLKLSYNRFRTLPDTSNYPKSLRSLGILGNNYNTIPSYAFKNLTTLTSLGVWGGAVTTLESNAFFGLNQIKSLDLEQANISKITNLTFNGLDSLEELSLFVNAVTSIEIGGFYGLKNLQNLYISYNKLTTLEPDVLNLKYMPRLKSVSIDGNPWYCDCHLRWLREKMDNAAYKIPYPDFIRCNGPPHLAGQSWKDLKPTEFVCK